MSLETPQEVVFFRGGSSHARGKQPTVVKGNGVIFILNVRIEEI